MRYRHSDRWPGASFERFEQPVQVLRQELLAEGRIGARPCELVLGDQVVIALAFEINVNPSGKSVVARLRLAAKLDRTGIEVSFGPISTRATINGQDMAIAFVFPGQGSQAVGMGKALAANFAAARQVFEEVDDALGSKLSTIIFEGPADTLTLTENAQPALMAVSLAVLRVLEAEADSIWRAMRNSSPAIRSANIRRWPRPAPSPSRTPRGCCARADRPCRRRYRSASAPWRR